MCCKVNVLTGVLEEGVGVVADAVSVVGAAVAKARVVAAAPLEGQAAGVGAMRSKGEEKDEMVLSVSGRLSPQLGQEPQPQEVFGPSLSATEMPVRQRC